MVDAAGTVSLEVSVGLSVGCAILVTKTGMIEVAAGGDRPLCQRRAHEDDRMLPQLVVTHRLRQVSQVAAEHHLLGPGHRIPDDAGGLRQISALQ